MFKAKINKHRTSYWRYLITITSIFLVSYQISYAWSITLDGLIQNISQIGTKTQRESSTSTASQKDLFFQTQKNITASANQSILQSIDSTLQAIQDNAKRRKILSCDIKKSDITTILSNTAWFIEEISRQWNIPLWTIIQEGWDIQSSCEQFLRCSKILQPTQSITTSKEIENCTISVYKKYNLNKQLRNNILTLPEKNNNDNIYLDWIKDNGFFDLLLDIGIIKDILFSKDSGPDIPQMIYYSLPTVAIPQNKTEPIIPGNISAIGWSSLPTNSATNPQNTDSQTNWIPQANANNNGLTAISNFINSIKETDTTTTTPNTAIGTTVVQSALCPIPTTSITETEYNNNDNKADSKTEQDIINDFYNTQDKILTLLSGFLYTPDEIGKIGTTNNGIANLIKTDNALPPTTQVCQSSCSNITSEFEKMTCEWNCCINQCKTISKTSDQIVCISQCLCGDFSTANDTLRVKICRVPAQPARVLAWKKINSIEEAVDEINEIFNKLKQNWLLTKRSKKQEFMDSSFSDIKFHEVFAFDIFVAIKPIYDKLQFKQKEETTKKDHQNIKNSNIFISWKMWQGQDKNKYLVIGATKTEEETEKTCITLWLTYDPTQKKCDTKKTQEISNNILDQLSKLNTPSIVNDKLYQFGNEHYLLRDQIYKQVTDIQTVADILKTKAENAQ